MIIFSQEKKRAKKVERDGSRIRGQKRADSRW
jgi:hypothetical protein